MKNEKVDKSKKTFAYICLKKIKGNEKTTLYLYEQSKNIIKQYAKKNDLQISEIYVDYTLNRLDIKNRSALKKLMDKIQIEEEVGQVLISDIKHISRNMEITKEVIDKIGKFGTKIVCCNTNSIIG